MVVSGPSNLHRAVEIRSVPLRRGRVCATRSGSNGGPVVVLLPSPRTQALAVAMAGGAGSAQQGVTSQRVSAAHLMPVVYRPRRSSLHQLPSTLSVPVAARASEAGGLLLCSSWLFKPRGLLPWLPFRTSKLLAAPTLLLAHPIARNHSTAIAELEARGEGGTPGAFFLCSLLRVLPVVSVVLNVGSVSGCFDWSG